MTDYVTPQPGRRSLGVGGALELDVRRCSNKCVCESNDSDEIVFMANVAATEIVEIGRKSTDLIEAGRSFAARVLLTNSAGRSNAHEHHDEERNSPVTKPYTLVDRVRGEFMEMPGLQLTIAQASRLWGLEVSACRHVIEVLVESAFLRWTPTGMVVRAER